MFQIKFQPLHTLQKPIEGINSPQEFDLLQFGYHQFDDDAHPQEHPQPWLSRGGWKVRVTSEWRTRLWPGPWPVLLVRAYHRGEDESLATVSDCSFASDCGVCPLWRGPPVLADRYCLKPAPLTRSCRLRASSICTFVVLCNAAKTSCLLVRVRCSQSSCHVVHAVAKKERWSIWPSTQGITWHVLIKVITWHVLIKVILMMCFKTLLNYFANKREHMCTVAIAPSPWHRKSVTPC